MGNARPQLDVLRCNVATPGISEARKPRGCLVLTTTMPVAPAFYLMGIYK